MEPRIQTSDVNTNLWQNKVLEDAVMPQVESLLEQALGAPAKKASLYDDCKRATDLWVGDQAVAVRVRDSHYLRYAGEITIRSQHSTGKKCELAKLMEGAGDWMFYGFSRGGKIIQWSLLDLDCVREVIRAGLYAIKTNKDGNQFYVIDLLLAEHWAPGLIHRGTNVSHYTGASFETAPHHQDTCP